SQPWGLTTGPEQGDGLPDETRQPLQARPERQPWRPAEGLQDLRHPRARRAGIGRPGDARSRDSGRIWRRRSSVGVPEESARLISKMIPSGLSILAISNASPAVRATRAS